jgi:hypothetical protein
MNSIWATSIWLYLGDVVFVAFVIWGSLETAIWAVKKMCRDLKMNLSYTQIKRFAIFQVVWLFASLLLFKFIILQGGPGFSHIVGTGNHGSVQVSTIGEGFAAIATIIGLIRWVRFVARHIVTWSKEDLYDSN